MRTKYSVPISVASKVLGKDPTYVRQGIITGILPIGYAFKKVGSSKYCYYISPKKFEELTGYVYDGNDE